MGTQVVLVTTKGEAIAIANARMTSVHIATCDHGNIFLSSFSPFVLFFLLWGKYSTAIPELFLCVLLAWAREGVVCVVDLAAFLCLRE